MENKNLRITVSMTGEEFNWITRDLKAKGIVRNDTHLADELGTTTQTLRNLRRCVKVPKVYILACAALMERVDPQKALEGIEH